MFYIFVDQKLIEKIGKKFQIIYLNGFIFSNFKNQNIKEGIGIFESPRM